MYEWVIALDYSSMYPSIIIEKNICFTTLSDAGTVESPIGVRFLNAQQRPGLLPRILGDLMRQRREGEAERKAGADPGEQAYHRPRPDPAQGLLNGRPGARAPPCSRVAHPQ